MFKLSEPQLGNELVIYKLKNEIIIKQLSIFGMLCISELNQVSFTTDYFIFMYHCRLHNHFILLPI